MKKTIYEPAYRNLVGKLRQARRRAGLTQAEAGDKLGRSRQWINTTEAGQLRLDVLQVVRLCRVYGLKAHELVRRMEEELSEEDPSSYVSKANGWWFHLRRWTDVSATSNWDPVLTMQDISYYPPCERYPCNPWIFSANAFVRSGSSTPKLFSIPLATR